MAKWKDLTPAQRRVALAKDVIARIQANELCRVTRGSYCDGLVDPKFRELDPNSYVNKSQVKELQKRCDVCAMGALFLSKIDKFNEVKWEDLNVYNSVDDNSTYVNVYNDTIVKRLRGSFSHSQLRKIERVFECCGNEGEWGKRFKNSADRLLAIMQNIVDNKGTFDPSIEYEIVEQ